MSRWPGPVGLSAMHGGTIGAESIPGRGSSFWFTLPTEGPVRRPAASAEAG